MKKRYIIFFVDSNTGLLGLNKEYESNSKKEACIKFKQEYPYCQIINVMVNKEFRVELTKLEEEIRALKDEEKELTFADLKAGESFKYQGLEFTKLDEELSIINTYKNIDCCFDNYNNDYEKSLIRYFINNRYCELMGINKDELLEVNEWGDKLTLLSKEEYERYMKHIKKYDNNWWLRSPLADSGVRAWCASAAFYVIVNPVYGAYGVRPALKFNLSIKVNLIKES